MWSWLWPANYWSRGSLAFHECVEKQSKLVKVLPGVSWSLELSPWHSSRRLSMAKSPPTLAKQPESLTFLPSRDYLALFLQELVRFFYNSGLQAAIMRPNSLSHDSQRQANNWLANSFCLLLFAVIKLMDILIRLGQTNIFFCSFGQSCHRISAPSRRWWSPVQKLQRPPVRTMYFELTSVFSVLDLYFKNEV